MRPIVMVIVIVLVAAAAPADASRRSLAVPQGGDTDPLAGARTACAQPSSPACRDAKDRLAEQVATDLMVVASSRDRRYHDAVRQVADVPYPRVRAAAAAALGAMTPRPADTETLKRLLNDPAPAVRYSALRAVARSTDPNVRLLRDRAQDTPRKGIDEDSLTEEPAPNEQRVGAPVYPRATYVYFASDPTEGRAAFVTDDPIDAVVRFYAGRGTRPAMSASEFEQTLAMASAKNTQDQQQQMTQAMELMKKVEELQKSGRSPQEIAAELQKLAAPIKVTNPSTFTKPYGRTDLYGSPRFILLSKPEETRAVRYAVVFQDLALGKTGVVVHVPATP